MTYDGTNRVLYATQLTNNTLEVSRLTEMYNPSRPQSIASTLSFSPDDIIFNSQGELYTPQSPEVMRLFEQEYDFTFTTQPVLPRTEIRGQSVLLINPRLPGVMVIRFPDTYIGWVDQDTRLIELIQVLPGDTNYAEVLSSFTIETYATLEEALQS